MGIFERGEKLDKKLDKKLPDKNAMKIECFCYSFFIF
jgi:hypothetical protein